MDELQDKGKKEFTSEKAATTFVDSLPAGYWTFTQCIHNPADFSRIEKCIVYWEKRERPQVVQIPDGHCNINGEYVTIYQEV